MSQTTQTPNSGKKYRIIKPELFSLDKHTLYLVVETPVGYVCHIDNNERMGFPKRVVETSKSLFQPYSHEQHNNYNHFKARKHLRPRINRPRE